MAYFNDFPQLIAVALLIGLFIWVFTGIVKSAYEHGKEAGRFEERYGRKYVTPSTFDTGSN